MTPQVAFKILTATQWAEFERDHIFPGSQVDIADGYIHLSTESQLRGTLEKHYKGQSDLRIAEVDLGMVGNLLRWEASRGGQLFPHIYGPLPIAAIRSVRSI